MRNGRVQEFDDHQIPRSEGFYINDKPDGPLREWHNNGQLKAEKFYNKGKQVGTWKEYFPSGNWEGTHMYNTEGHLHGQAIWYYENGQKKSFDEYENGLTKPDRQSLVWYADGSPEYEATYRAGRQVEVKRWNQDGKIYEHKVYDAETQSYREVDHSAPADTTRPYVSPPYTGPTDFTDDGIRGNWQDLKYYLFGFMVLLLLGYLFWWMWQPL
ncbi:hypothetical protein [Mucilaginibacter sp. CSA2-8R]|uniref:toxin-antitoxin system YwqK family antitoxin n=1 Tax=Mucilaginibacter sp. CSA2-8R TaxID=3141542 RepID=UPI00315C830D